MRGMAIDRGRRLRRRGACAAAAGAQAMLLRLASACGSPALPCSIQPGGSARRSVICVPSSSCPWVCCRPARGASQSILLLNWHIRRHVIWSISCKWSWKACVLSSRGVVGLRVICAERENCCDDLVVATQGDAFVYAAALTALEQNRAPARETVLAATG
jgi:hypothetical protein